MELSRQNLKLAILAGFVALVSATQDATFAQACGAVTVNSYNSSYSATATQPFDRTYRASASIADVRQGQRLVGFWTKYNRATGLFEEISATRSQIDIGSAQSGQNITIGESTYQYAAAAARVDTHVTDFRYVFQSSCPGTQNPQSPCTCSNLTQTSEVYNFGVNPFIQIDVNANGNKEAVRGGSANFSVTALDGGNNSTLRYQWYRSEPDSSDVALTGATTSSRNQTLNLLEETGDYYVVITHNIAASDPNPVTYGRTESSSARLFMITSNLRETTDSVCRAPSANLQTSLIATNGTLVAPNTYSISRGNSISIDFPTQPGAYDNGLGSCYFDSGPNTGRSYLNCDDLGRAATPTRKKFYIAYSTATPNLPLTRYRYESSADGVNFALLPNHAFDDLNTINLNYNPSYDQLQSMTDYPTANRYYRMRATSVPCAATPPAVSNVISVQVLDPSVTITNEWAYRYDSIAPTYDCGGFPCTAQYFQNPPVSYPIIPNPFVTKKAGGLYFQIDYSTSGGIFIQNFQWERRSPGSGVWTNVGMDSNTFTIADGSLDYSDAGDYRLGIVFCRDMSPCAPGMRGTVYSSTFNVQVVPQEFNTVSVAAGPIYEEGSLITLQGSASPTEAYAGTSVTYLWERRTLPSGAFAPVAGCTNLECAFTAPVGSYELQLTASNYHGAVTSSPVTTFNVRQARLQITTQPTNQTVVDGANATFVVSGTAGGATVSYQWQVSPDGSSWISIPSATQNQFSLTANYATNHLTQYRALVTANGSTMNSSAAILNVGLRMTTQPSAQVVTQGMGQNATFVSEAMGLPTISYQWERSINGGSTWSDVGGATSTVLTIVNPDLSYNGNVFRLRARSTSVTGTLYSSPGLLTVNAPQCSEPNAPDLFLPEAAAVNVSLLPSFTWRPVQGVSGCNISYSFQLALDSGYTNLIIGITGQTGTIFNQLASLLPSRIHYWRVQACAAPSGGGNPRCSTWSERSFTTTSAETPAPTDLFSLPYTTPDRPAANRQIILGAYNGERFATGQFYLRRSSGDVLVGETEIGSLPNGRFEISVDLLNYISGPSAILEFYARQRRPGQTTSGPASARSVIYYYQNDANILIFPPVLERASSTTGDLKWLPVSGATSYQVYRRVGIDDSPAGGDILFLANRPWRQIATGAFTTTNGYVTFTDPNPPAMDQHGVNYFVTARDAQGNISQRSNSQSFQDQMPPRRSREQYLNNQSQPNGIFKQQIEFIDTTNSGRSVQGFLCNLNARGFFHDSTNSNIDYRFFEGSADILAYVQVAPAPLQGACSEQVFQAASQSFILPFDAVSNSSGVDHPTSPGCLYVGEIGNLQPNTPYCFKTCLKDPSNNPEGASCLDSTIFSTRPDQQAPDFAGINSISPGEDGKSMHVSWNLPPNQQFINEPLDFLVTYTQNFDEAGRPIFTTNDDVRTVEGNSTSALIDRLSTNSRYCFKVEARDQSRNTSETNVSLCGDTLNNLPIVDALSVARDPVEAQKVIVSFKLIDRNSDPVQLSHMSYRVNEFQNWVEVNSKHISGNSDFLASADSFESAPSHEVIFDTLSYFAGRRDGFQMQLVFRDIEGNERTVETESRVAYASQSQNAALARGFGGCSLQAESNSQKTQKPLNSLILVSLAMAALLLALRLTRYRRDSSG